MIQVTLFDQSKPENEIEQGKNLVDACKEIGIQLYVWRCAPGIVNI